VRKLKTDKEREFFWDSSFKLRGSSFGVRVTRSGSRTYYLSYRNFRGQQRRIAIGKAELVSLQEARKKAKSLSAEIDRGDDPAQSRFDIRRASSVRELCKYYIDEHCQNRLSSKTLYEYERIIKCEIVPKIGLIKANNVRRIDIKRLVREIEVKRGKARLAHHTRALIHAIFQFAVYEEILEFNPCSGVERVKKASPRTRVLSDSELVKVIKALEEEAIPMRGIFTALLLTAQRSGEVLGMKWSELKEGNSIWVIPPSRTKNGTEHLVHISPELKKMLRLVRENLSPVYFAHQNLRDYVFASPNNSFGHVKWIRKACNRIIDRAEIEHFTPHDLRRTAATGIRALDEPKVDRETVAKILNHKSYSVTALHYDHHLQLIERKEALYSWSRKIDHLSKEDKNLRFSLGHE
jgi:integrase